MQAIILAAGLGTRLKPLTDNKPKCLVEVNGQPILANQIEALLEAGIQDIFVVSGHHHDKIKEHVAMHKNNKIKTIFNSKYHNTNNMHSLYLALKEVNDSFLLMNGDVFFDQTIIYDLSQNKEHNLIAVDQGSFTEESMKVIVHEKENKILDISKVILKDQAFGNSIDLYLIQKQYKDTLQQYINKIIEEENNLTDWTEKAFQRMIKEDIINFKPFDINQRKWMEIDNHEDLKLAENIFN